MVLTSRKLRLLIPAIVLVAAVLAPPAISGRTAPRTTGPGYTFVIGVRLTDHGVGFTKQQRVPLGSTVQFLIVNLSSNRRWFNIGGRQTHLLKPKVKEIFFLAFDVRAKIPYRSWGPHAKTFRGSFEVT